jgi:hypothetical protein
MTKFNSIQFKEYLLMSRLNRTSSYYEASTKTQIEHKNTKNTQKQTLKRQNENNIAEKNNIEVLGQNPYTLKKHRYA